MFLASPHYVKFLNTKSLQMDETFITVNGWVTNLSGIISKLINIHEHATSVC